MFWLVEVANFDGVGFFHSQTLNLLSPSLHSLAKDGASIGFHSGQGTEKHVGFFILSRARAEKKPSAEY